MRTVKAELEIMIGIPTMAKISDKNSKLGKIPNISLIPVKDCPNSERCKKDCYAKKAWKQYPNVRKAWKHNSQESRKNPDQFFADIRAFLTKKNPEFFRIHVAGDFYSLEYFNQWIELIKEFPGVKFLAFTKAFENIHSDLPGNFSLILSRWPGDTAPMEPIGPMAWVQDGTETRIPENAIQCPGKCDTCGMCWNLPALNVDVYFKIH